MHGICLAGFNEFDLRVDGPVDVEFASLIYQGRVVAQFRTNILGPEVEVPNEELNRWRSGALIVVKSANDYVGVKKYGSGAYPNVYVSLVVGKHLPPAMSTQTLMYGLVSCKLNAPLDISSPPKIDTLVTEAR
jgi:hypothetical protein